MFSQTVHEAYIEVIEETSVCIIKRSELQELLLKYPSISLKVLAECVDNEKQSMKVVLPTNKKDMASYLGTTPETISKKLADLKEAGYIKQISNKKVKILNLDGLLLI